MAEAGRRRRFPNLAVSGSNRPETSHFNNPYESRFRRLFVPFLACLPFFFAGYPHFPINIKTVDDRGKMMASNLIYVGM